MHLLHDVPVVVDEIDLPGVARERGEAALLRRRDGIRASDRRRVRAKRRPQLHVSALGRDHDVFDRAIDVQVSRLRKLIEIDVAAPRYIQTVWGFGYVFVPDASASEVPVTGSGA